MRCLFPLSVRLGIAAAAFAFSSCASVSVRNVVRDEAIKSEKPSHIYIVPFEVDAAGVKENAARKAPGELANEARRLVAQYLEKELSKLGTPASIASGKIAPKANTWVVSGRITRVAEGSRILRMSIGLGSGGTKMETDVIVRSGARKDPLLRFATSGGSNATPGGLTNPVPFSGVPTAILNSKEGVTDDSARTARMIAGTIGRYMADRGWIAAENAPVVKMARE
jgi:hypothetical protein